VSGVTAAERETLAREALAEITAIGTFGDFISETAEGEDVYTLLFAATMGGYPGWHWTVSVAELPDSPPTVLEAELLPGDGSLLAPEWVPWSDRLVAGEDLDVLVELDFEGSDLLAVGEDEKDQPEAEADDDGPEPPAVAPVKKRRQKKQEPGEGD
jgi:hypothetical protein